MSLKQKIKTVLRQARPTKDEQGRIVCDPKPLVLKTDLKTRPKQEDRFLSMLRAHQIKMQEEQAYRDETDFGDDEVDPTDAMLSKYERDALIFDMVEEAPTPNSERATAPQKAEEQASEEQTTQ